MPRLVLGLVLFFWTQYLFGQDITVRGQFLADSIKIGVVFPYSLSARYPKEYNVLFPDSTFSFTPFEFHHKTFVPTVTGEDISYDSVTYFLKTFEIDSIQRLALPIFVVNQSDSISIFPDRDSLFLKQLVAQVPDSVSAQELPLKINTSYLDVSWLLNYPLLVIIVGVVLITAIVLWIIFGKRIKKYFALRRLNKSHANFMQHFQTAIHKTQIETTPKNAEQVLILWKNYMEKLLSNPFSKYTTKEIFQIIHNEPLAKALKSVDQLIYSTNSTFKNRSFDQLKEFSEQCFHQKIEELKHE